MESLALVSQIVIALGLLNVWLLRAKRPTAYRGGDAQNMKEEFEAYGLPAWFMGPRDTSAGWNMVPAHHEACGHRSCPPHAGCRTDASEGEGSTEEGLAGVLAACPVRHRHSRVGAWRGFPLPSCRADIRRIRCMVCVFAAWGPHSFTLPSRSSSRTPHTVLATTAWPPAVGRIPSGRLSESTPATPARSSRAAGGGPVCGSEAVGVRRAQIGRRLHSRQHEAGGRAEPGGSLQDGEHVGQETVGIQPPKAIVRARFQDEDHRRLLLQQPLGAPKGPGRGLTAHPGVDDPVEIAGGIQHTLDDRRVGGGRIHAVSSGQAGAQEHQHRRLGPRRVGNQRARRRSARGGRRRRRLPGSVSSGARRDE
jgi:hypothetical protein